MYKMMNYLSILLCNLIVLPFCYGGFYETYTKLQDHTSMSKHRYRKIAARSLVECLAECHRSPVCHSFSYKQVICHLNTNSKDSSSVRPWGHFTLGTMAPIDGNPNHPCASTSLKGISNKDTKSSKATSTGKPATGKGSGHMTLPGRSGCSEEFQGCGEPPTLPGAGKAYYGHYLDAVVNYTCQGGYLNCLNKTRSLCKATGKWDSLSGLCGQSVWTIPPSSMRYTVPCGPSDTFILNIIGTLTKPTRMSVDLRCNRGLALQIVFQYRYGSHKKKVYLRNYIDNKWGNSKLISIFPIVLGEEFDMTISKKADNITVAANGVFIADFLSEEKVEVAVINFDVTVKRLQFTL